MYILGPMPKTSDRVLSKAVKAVLYAGIYTDLLCVRQRFASLVFSIELNFVFELSAGLLAARATRSFCWSHACRRCDSFVLCMMRSQVVCPQLQFKACASVFIALFSLPRRRAGTRDQQACPAACGTAHPDSACWNSVDAVWSSHLAARLRLRKLHKAMASLGRLVLSHCFWHNSC